MYKLIVLYSSTQWYIYFTMSLKVLFNSSQLHKYSPKFCFVWHFLNWKTESQGWPFINVPWVLWPVTGYTSQWQRTLVLSGQPDCYVSVLGIEHKVLSVVMQVCSLFSHSGRLNYIYVSTYFLIFSHSFCPLMYVHVKSC